MPSNTELFNRGLVGFVPQSEPRDITLGDLQRKIETTREVTSVTALKSAEAIMGKKLPSGVFETPSITIDKRIDEQYGEVSLVAKLHFKCAPKDPISHSEDERFTRLRMYLVPTVQDEETHFELLSDPVEVRSGEYISGKMVYNASPTFYHPKPGLDEREKLVGKLEFMEEIHRMVNQVAAVLDGSEITATAAEAITPMMRKLLGSNPREVLRQLRVEERLTQVQIGSRLKIGPMTARAWLIRLGIDTPRKNKSF